MTLKPDEIEETIKDFETWLTDCDCQNARKYGVNYERRIRTIRKALTAYKKMQWQPIETAPRDGTLILIRINKQWIASARWIKTPKGECWDYGLSETKPTHWMPLPEQPSKGDVDE